MFCAFTVDRKQGSLDALKTEKTPWGRFVKDDIVNKIYLLLHVKCLKNNQGKRFCLLNKEQWMNYLHVNMNDDGNMHYFARTVQHPWGASPPWR